MLDQRTMQACARILGDVKATLEGRPGDEYQGDDVVPVKRTIAGVMDKTQEAHKAISCVHESLMSLMERLGMVLLPDPGDAAAGMGSDAPVMSDLGREMSHITERINGLDSLVRHITGRIDL